MRINRDKVGSGQWAVGSQEQVRYAALRFCFSLSTAHCLLLTVFFLLSHAAAFAQTKRIVVLKDGLVVADTIDYQRAMDALHAASELDDVAPAD